MGTAAGVCACPRAPCDIARLTTLCLHTSSHAPGTGQCGGNAEAGIRYSQDLLLLSFRVSTGQPGPAGARSPRHGSEDQQVSRGRPRRALSSRERDPGAPLQPEWLEHGPGCIASVRTSVPPTAAVLPATPCVHVLGGNRAQSVRVPEAALPWASPCGGQRFTRRCTGSWGSAAAEGPPSLAGAALGGPLMGPALGPSPA